MLKQMATRTKHLDAEKAIAGSGNIFADMGLPNAKQELLKAQLTLQIYSIIKDRRLTQAEAAKILGIQQPRVSSLARNRSGDGSWTGRRNHRQPRRQRAWGNVAHPGINGFTYFMKLALRRNAANPWAAAASHPAPSSE
jgi:predicted XRE-type DNA-binding protein